MKKYAKIYIQNNQMNKFIQNDTWINKLKIEYNLTIFLFGKA